MASGRLDEALQILQASDQRRHRDGQRLTDRLLQAFVDRAHQHLEGNRLQDARGDAERAGLLGGRQAAVAELLQKIAAAEAERRRSRQECQNVLASAEKQMRAGEFAAGAQLLDGLPPDASVNTAAVADQMARSIEVRRELLEQAADRIQQAIGQEDYEGAVALLGQLLPEEQTASSIAALSRDVAAPLAEQGLSDLAAGRLDRAAATGALLQTLPTGCTAALELQRCLSGCAAIRQSLTAHRYEDAESQLRILEQILAGSSWVAETCEAVGQIAGRLNQVLAGPLGLLPDESLQSSRGAASEAVSAVSSDRHAAGLPHRGTGLPLQSVLQVDGLGRLLLLTGDVISVGASSDSSRRVDVRLLTDGEHGAISIRRDGDDYFAEAMAEFRVNGTPVKRRLLASGDSIAVGQRGRLKFLKPVPASSSAVLQITGARLVQREIRNVVLMADSLLFGPAGAHFRVADVVRPLVLHSGSDGFALRETSPVRAEHRRGDRSSSVSLNSGQSVLMSDVRFALEEVTS